MTIYIGIAAVRIQTWLLRTPELKLMRGASKALSTHTAMTTIQGWLQGFPELAGVEVASDAGDVDGVVVLQIPDTSTLEAGQVTAAVLTHLSAALPGVEWDVWSCSGANYLTAYSAQRYNPGHVHRLTWLPPLQDVRIARGCRCGREPSGQYLDERGERLGPDCAARHRAQREDATDDRLRPQESSWSDIPGCRMADDFDELARKGGLGSDDPAPLAHGRQDSRNHLATIVADGNAMGAFFDLIADSPSGLDLSELRQAAVYELSTTTQKSVIAAGKAVAGVGNVEVKPAIPHYVGGDDIFVSVPAVLAWRFAHALATAFQAYADALYRAIPGGDGRPEEHRTHLEKLNTATVGISLGIGMCFANASHPIGDTHSAAEHAMKAAKMAGRGKAAWVGWRDLTEGDRPLTNAGPVPAQVVSIEEIDQWLGAGQEAVDVFSLTPSARGTLRDILRDHADRAAREDAVEVWAMRTGWAHTSEVDRLPDMLSLARWWPNTRDEEDAP